MKTSKRIIIGVASFVLVYGIISLIVFRNKLKPLVSANAENRYEEVAVDDFEGLDFSAGWRVEIQQGNEYKVEWLEKEYHARRPGLENKNGILYFTHGKPAGKEEVRKIHARITAPSLKIIREVKDTEIHLESFSSDSLRVILQGGIFVSDQNSFNYVSFETSGDARIEIKNNKK